MTLTILSSQSKAIQKLVKSQMDIERIKSGFDPYGDTAQEEFERRVMELEQRCLENPDLDIEVMYYELHIPISHNFP